MGEYGYAYKSASTYSTTSVRNETRKPAIQPFVPFVPKNSTDHGGYSEGHVTRKTIIPVTSSRPYDDSTPISEKYLPKPKGDDEWHRKTNPVRHTTVNNHDGYDGHGSNNYDQYHAPDGYGGYGGYDNQKEGYKPISNNNANYNSGYGIGNGNNKEQHRSFGFGSSTPNHKYDRERPGHMHMDKPIGPKISSAWTAAPRKGTQLSEPTNDIEKALELLRMEAAKREHMQNNTDYEYEYDHRPTPTPLANWAAPPGRKFNKPTGSPQYVSPTRVNNKFGNSYEHVPVIDSREAEKKFKGTRVW